MKNYRMMVDTWIVTKQSSATAAASSRALTADVRYYSVCVTFHGIIHIQLTPPLALGTFYILTSFPLG